MIHVKNILKQKNWPGYTQLKKITGKILILKLNFLEKIKKLEEYVIFEDL